MLTVVDLFAGAGGLSQGFLQAGYTIKAAYEKNKYARATYVRNIPDVEVYEDVIGADYEKLMAKHGTIDVVIGGPPCQGFSKANRQHSQAISLNNKLIKEYVRAILSVKPKAFVMENVDMLQSSIHRFFLENADIETVDKYGVPYIDDTIDILRDNELFSGAERVIRERDISEALYLDEKHYICLRVMYRQRNNRSKFLAALTKYKRTIIELVEKMLSLPFHIEAIDVNYSEMAGEIKEYYRTGFLDSRLKSHIEFCYRVQQMVLRMREIHDNDIVCYGVESSKELSISVKSCAVFDYIQNILERGDQGYSIITRVINAADYGVPQKRMRFIIMGIRKDIAPYSFYFPVPTCSDYYTVRSAIEDLENLPVSYDKDSPPIQAKPYNVGNNDLLSRLRDSNYIYNHMTTLTKDVALERFRHISEGQNFHSLEDSLKSTYADEKRTQNTIYLRLTYDLTSGTVINVRKSMWIHPRLDRALSVREAARIQSFPDSFAFIGTKDSQYQQVGNAVPPIMAEAIALHLKAIILDNCKS